MPWLFRTAFVLAAAPALALAQPPTTVVTPAELPGQAIYEGSATRRLLLNAVQPGAPLAFVEIRPGSRVPPHGHSQEDLVAVLVVRGPVFYADGEQANPAALRPFESGTVLLVPRGNWHYLQAREADVLLLAIPARREALPPAIAARLPAR